MLSESRQQKRWSDSWRKNTDEGAPTAKSSVKICTSASLSAEWKHRNWHRDGSKATHLKLNAEFRPTVYACFWNDRISNTSPSNKFCSSMICQIEQLSFWSYFCIFFSGPTAFLKYLFSLIFTFTFSFLCWHYLHWFFYSSFFQFDRCV